MTQAVSAEPLPAVVNDAVSGLALMAGAANVVMQLAQLPVGHGVAESKVDSGRLDKHPLKRTRTTMSYLMIAYRGTEHERAVLRNEVNKAHRHVRSDEKSPVQYNAFDRDLQLWVAACLYRGVEDTYKILYGPPDPGTLDELYRHSIRFATTLQVTEDMWPADRAAFEDYWNDSLRKVEMDDTTRAFLNGLVDLAWLPQPVPRLLGPFHRLVTGGFLPRRFQEELGMTWTPHRQRAFDRITRTAALINRSMPRVLREFPLNYYLWDARRRIRLGRPLV